MGPPHDNDGRMLFTTGYPAAGAYENVIRRWTVEGRGIITDLNTGSSNTIKGLIALPDGSIAFCTAEPHIGILEKDGEQRLFIGSLKVEYRGDKSAFQVSSDGTTVKFDYDARAYI